MRRATLAVCAAALTLQGCATYNLSLLPRTAGPMAHGTAKQMSQSVTVKLDGRTYKGRYALVEGGSFALTSANDGGQKYDGTAVNVNALGNGNVLAQSADGHNLRCVFTFRDESQSGTGVCLTDAGAAYDLQITR